MPNTKLESEECLTKPSNFVATVFGDLTPLQNSALSKARLRIFYKGANRNGSYITDEVAEKLLATLPGTPIVGFYDADKDDFLGHEDKEKSRAYGFVPEDLHFSWEMNLDPDGVYRTYACTDIILWTGRYPIASRIVGKSHSMELNPATVSGDWVEHDGDIYFEFSHAEFIGLCALGNDYEPCFEGSSFYELHKNEESSLSKDLKELFSLYKTMNYAEENLTGGQTMDEKEQEVSEEVAETPVDNVEVEVKEEVKEEVAEEVVTDSELNEEVVDNKDSEPIEENEEKEEDVEEEVNEEENSEEEEEVNEEEEDVEEEEESDVEEECEEEDNEDYALIIQQKDAEIEALKAELATLNEYKATKIKEEKEAMLSAYSERLSEEEKEEFINKLDSYDSALELKKDIAVCLLDRINNTEVEYALVKTNTEKAQYSGAEAIIAKHVNKK